jgi:D-glycero-alpha-D-manno-heptose-7-phosphate kinase
LIISRTPFRVSFFGGGTDYPRWFRENGGDVLASSIDKYCYITGRYLPPFFEHKYRIVWSKSEIGLSIDDISHPAVRAILHFLNIDRGLEIHYDGDLPARSGMGSSSSFVVSLLHTLYALKGVMVSKEQLATESIHIEQQIMNETVGSQDQISAAYGGLNHIHFHQTGEFTVSPVTLKPERVWELESHIMLFYSGIKRTASDVAASYVHDIDKRVSELKALGDMVGEGLAILNSDHDIREFGKLLHEGWAIKRSLAPLVSNTEVDDIYNAALSAGAVGGKITGAGGGGFILLFVPPERQDEVREKLGHLVYILVGFDRMGSQIIFFDPERDYSAAEIDRNRRSIASFRELDNSNI